ncbi:IS5 family transposase [Nannocystis punicea]|uniref:IS5 family transposase n=1 Tax=Nannocystis punicea TaxID=2995304 RepID=A0ABY7H618_9BACT|nr:IS5 family transposase [Nannocystis poenicansa]WAS94726.1 IS5 family transposase [Nannocystis poenicansa]
MTPRVPRHQLTDDQWNLIADLFPTRNCKTGRRARDRRTILNAIFWVLRTGAPWRDLPIEFGPWSTAWDFFNKWNQDGTFDEVLRRLRSCVFRMATHPPSSGASTARRSARLAAAAAGGKSTNPEEPKDHALGRSRGGWGTKIHILCDAHGHPLHFHLSAGQIHDQTMVDTLLCGADETLHDEHGTPMAWPVALAGDKGYRANWVDQYLLELGIKPIIPSKENEDRSLRPVAFDKAAYRGRSIIECLIGWLKESRRIATRFGKKAINFGAMVKLAFIHRYLRLRASCAISDMA